MSKKEASVLLSYEDALQRFETDPRMKFVGDYLLLDWREQLEEKKTREAREMRATFEQLIPALNNELKELHSAGLPLLAGSDAAVLFSYPESSLYAELQALVKEVGLSPREALQSATTAPARFFGMSDRLGRVLPGYLGDFVLLDADPLRDIGNIRRITGVSLCGRWFDRSALERLIETAAGEARIRDGGSVP